MPDTCPRALRVLVMDGVVLNTFLKEGSNTYRSSSARNVPAGQPHPVAILLRLCTFVP